MGVTISESIPVRGLKEFCLHMPLSITNVMLSIVSEVSATFVASTTFLTFGGVGSKHYASDRLPAPTSCCSLRGSAE